MADTDDLTREDGSDDEADLRKFRKWFRNDRDFSREWREAAREEYDFTAGKQWSDDDERQLRNQQRPAMVFNHVARIVNAVCGAEIQNRQEVRFIPREMGDVRANELLTSAAQWFRDVSDAEDEESGSFRDTVVCGMGWTDTRIDFDLDPEGAPDISRLDPLEMLWDKEARKSNLADANRLWRVRQFTKEEARRLFPDAEDNELDCRWADLDEPDTSDGNRPEEVYRDDGTPEESADDLVTIVHLQYRERESFWTAQNPLNGQKIDGLNKSQHDKLKKRFAEMAEHPVASQAMIVPFKSVKRSKWVYRQAFIGSVVLEHGDAPCPDHFSFQCITGYRDRNKGTWYGIVRVMMDPQRWANKWLSQVLHILNSNAKGGVMMEEGIAADERTFEQDWAKPNSAVKFKPGTLSSATGPKILPKPQPVLPQGFYQLMEFAFLNIREVPGVNAELMGIREAVQPGVLEYQRKQAGMTMLATLFDSLRRYRKRQGHVMLYHIQQLSDGRLIRILGEQGEMYVPLIKQADAQYDIIVDEAATSPNQKEMTWQLIMPFLPTLPPPVVMALLKYSPLPESVQRDIQQAAEKMSASPEAKAQKQLQFMGATAEVEKTKSETAENQAQTQQTMVETMLMPAKQAADARAAMVKARQPQQRPMR